MYISHFVMSESINTQQVFFFLLEIVIKNSQELLVHSIWCILFFCLEKSLIKLKIKLFNLFWRESLLRFLVGDNKIIITTKHSASKSCWTLNLQSKIFIKRQELFEQFYILYNLKTRGSLILSYKTTTTTTTQFLLLIC